MTLAFFKESFSVKVIGYINKTIAYVALHCFILGLLGYCGESTEYRVTVHSFVIHVLTLPDLGKA